MLNTKNVNLCTYPDVMGKDACKNKLSCGNINICTCNSKCSYRKKGYQLKVTVEKNAKAV